MSGVLRKGEPWCTLLVARPLREKISELIGDIPALLVHEFLDLEAVMPPERLRWSRALGRPFMSGAEPDDDIIGPGSKLPVLVHFLMWP